MSSAGSGTIRLTMPCGGEVEHADLLELGHLGGVRHVAVHDRARALGRQRRQPGVLGRDDLRAGRSASAPPPQPCPRTTDTVGTVIVVSVAMHRAISPAIARSSACGDSSAPGVSMTVTSGMPSSSARRIAAPGLAQRARPHRRRR